MTEYPREMEGISQTRREMDRALTKGAINALYWYTKHWLFLLNVIMGAIVALIFLAPYLMSLGWLEPARAVYLLLSPFCHQMPTRSFFLFGYQMGVCERNMAIYAATFLAGLAYIPLRRRLSPLPLWLFALFTLPIALDGFTQLFSLRESTWELRLITGSLFGLGGVWLTYPMMDRACRKTRAAIERRP